MKYILMFLISFNLYAMSYTRINNLTVNKVLYTLANRMEKECVKVNDAKPFRVNNISCTNGTPTLAAFQNELTTYQNELTIAEDARLAEKARIQDLRVRFKAIKYSKNKVLKVSNPAAWFRDNKSSMDPIAMEDTMLALEAADAQAKIDLKAEGDVKTTKDTQKSSDCVKLKNSNKYPLYLKRLFYGKLCN